MKATSLLIAITYKALAGMLGAVFLLVMVFGIAFVMPTSEHGHMPNCPFMSEQASICSMGVAEHIAKWQEFFTAAIFESSGVVYMLCLLFAFTFLAIFARAPNATLFGPVSHPLAVNAKEEAKLFNHIAISFSQGILNPRLYV